MPKEILRKTSYWRRVSCSDSDLASRRISFTGGRSSQVIVLGTLRTNTRPSPARETQVARFSRCPSQPSKTLSNSLLQSLKSNETGTSWSNAHCLRICLKSSWTATLRTSTTTETQSDRVSTSQRAPWARGLGRHLLREAQEVSGTKAASLRRSTALAAGEGRSRRWSSRAEMRGSTSVSSRALRASQGRGGHQWRRLRLRPKTSMNPFS